MPFYNDIPDEEFMPRQTPLVSSLGIGPKVTKAISGATREWLDEHPEATTTVQDHSITTVKLFDKAVTKDKLAIDSVDHENIIDDAVREDSIADGSVTTPKLADSAVTTQKIANASVTYEKLAVDAIPTMSDTMKGIAKVGAGLAMNGDMLELDGSGSIATAVQSWLNNHPEATTTVQDGSVSMQKLDQEVSGIVTNSKFLFGSSRCIEFEYGYIAGLGTITELDPFNTPVSSSENMRHVFIECSLGDIFEVDLYGGTDARCWALMAGPDYSTPYHILMRVDRVMSDNVPMRTYLVINDPDARYLLLQTKFGDHPESYAKKISLDEYLMKRLEIDYKWMFGHYLRRNALNSDGDSMTHATAVISPFIPVRYGDIVEGCLSNFTDSVFINYYDSNFSHVMGLFPGEGNTTATDFSLRIPEHGWICVSWYLNLQYVDESEEWAHELFSHSRFRITDTSDYVSKDLLSNSYEELEFLRASRMYTANTTPCLTLLHLTDIHGDAYSMREIQECLRQTKTFGKYIDGAVCTGDILFHNVEDSSDFVESYCNLYRPIMLTLGNHDQRPQSTARWHYAGESDIITAYQRFIEPYIQTWGVTTNEAEMYSTYYYKDYPTQKVRLIALDPNMGSAYVPTNLTRQFDWLENVLEQARTLDYGVVIAQHFPVQGTPHLINCNFTDIMSVAYTHMGDSNYNESTVRGFQSRVQDFIDAGGDFICWLSGHNHADFVYYVDEYPDQLCIICGVSSTLQDSRLADRSEGKARLLFNTVTVSRGDHQVRLVRFGANASRYMASKRSLCVDYRNMQVLAQS